MRKETEKLEFKKSTGEIKEAIISLSSMLNKHGAGRLIFGVSPNGSVVKNQISESSLRDISRRIYEGIEPRIYPLIDIIVIDEVEVIEVVVEGNEQPYSAFGRYYIRTADEDRELGSYELKRNISNLTYLDSWETHLTEFDLDDVDETSLKSFFEDATKYGRLPELEYNKEKLLGKLGLYRENKLTNAGNAMFSKRGPITLKLAMFATDEKLTFLDIKTINGNVYNLIKEAQIFVEKNIRWSGEIIGHKRIEIPEIPTEALREIIVNSFAHAQYNKDTYHEIRIHPSKIVIYSLGSFKSNYRPEEYITSDYPSSIRNSIMTKVLYMAKAIEQFGSGFKRVDSLCKDYNIKYEYTMLNNGFEFLFKRKILAAHEINDTPEFIMTKQAEIAYNYLKQDANYTREDLSLLMSKSERTIQRYFTELREKGFIERVGSDKTGYWKILK